MRLFERRQDARGFGLGAITLLAALLFGLAVEALGLTAAVDAGLEQSWVRLGAALGIERESQDRVVLVAADAETFAAWGPGPWPRARLDAILDGLGPAAPALVAEVGYGQMFRADETPVDASLVLAGERPSLWVRGGLQDNALHVDADSSFAALARRVGLGSIDETLTVDWLLPRTRLDQVSALAVAEGRVAPERLAGRVVLLGVDDPSHATQVDTALGRLSPAVIEAHALSGLIDGRGGRGLGLGLGYGLALVLAALVLLAQARCVVRRGLTIGAGLLALIILIDLVGHMRGQFELGTTRWLVVVFAALVGHWVGEMLTTSWALQRLWSEMVVEGGAVSGEDLDLADADFWRDMNQLASLASTSQVPHARSVLLERVDRSWRLRAHLHEGLDANDVDELPLALWRAPYRGVVSSLRPRSVEGLLAGHHSMVLPLAHAGEVLGVWVVHAPIELSRRCRADFEAMAARMSRTLARRRERLALQLGARLPSLREHAVAVEAGVRQVEDRKAWSLDLLDQLPLNAMICSVWGEVEHVSARMQAQLDEHGDGAEGSDLRTLLGRVTGANPAKVQTLMRKVLLDGVAVQLRAIGAEGSQLLWTLSRLDRPVADTLRARGATVESSFLLTCWTAAARASSTGSSSSDVVHARRQLASA